MPIGMLGVVIWACENILDAQMGNVWLRPKFHVRTATKGVVYVQFDEFELTMRCVRPHENNLVKLQFYFNMSCK
jgi:hypothetical protein